MITNFFWLTILSNTITVDALINLFMAVWKNQSFNVRDSATQTIQQDVQLLLLLLVNCNTRSN